MGSADSKVDISSPTSSRWSATGGPDSADTAALVRAPSGVRLRQLEGNNFLGRLADAKRFTAGGGAGLSFISNLSQRLATRVTANSSGGSAGSGGGCCVTPPDSNSDGRRSSVQQRPPTSPMTSTPIWSLAGGHYQYQHHRQQQHQERQNHRHHQHQHHQHQHHQHQHQHQHHQHQHHQHQHRHHRQQADAPNNLTALLVRGFDPAEYDKREKEHRRRLAARAAKSRQQQEKHGQDRREQKPCSSGGGTTHSRVPKD